ncbi:MAG: peptidase [Deltaproteobacteria bacterium]|nr:peptidase [Deltaproteobacteria bacterium]
MKRLPAVVVVVRRVRAACAASLAAAAALAALSSQGACSAPHRPDAPPAGARFALDETKLPAPVRFTRATLDDATPACVDLAGHVNRRWLDENPLPGDRTTWGAFEVLDERSKAVQRQLVEQAAAVADADGVVKLVGDLWATGMDEAAIEARGLAPLQSRLAAIDALQDGAAIAAFLRTSHARGEAFVFDFSAEPDFKDSSRNIAYVTQGGLGLPDRGYYFDDDKKTKLAAYGQHVERMLALSGVTAEAAKAQATDVVAFEARLARVSKSSEELSRDVALYYHPVTVAAADALTPGFAWSAYFDAVGVARPAQFSLAMPDFHVEVAKMLGDVPAATWRAYLRFHTVDGLSPFLPSAFVDENFRFYRATMRGQKELQPRFKRVLDVVNRQVGEALGQLYVQVAFPASSKARMQALVGNLSAALKGRLEQLEWMGPETKAKALAKWASFTPKIGYPDQWRDWTGLSTSRSSYVENVLAAVAFNQAWELAKVGKPVDRSEWGMPPQTVNAYYNPQANEIVFPAAILQPPFFDPAADDALNYGGIGAVIGHEMIHGYDDQGSRFGPTGNFEVWWTGDDSKRFADKTAQLVEQFSAYEALPGHKVNGALTLGENIADLGGIAVAFDALQAATAGQHDPMIDGLRQDQRFFYGWGTVWRRKFTDDELKVRLTTDPHAPATFRAIGPPSNLSSFARAFGCKAGDPMVRDDAHRITIW